MVTEQTLAGSGIPEATGEHLGHPGEEGPALQRVGKVVQPEAQVIRPGVKSGFGCLIDT